jgi:hypothetical protein
LLFKTEAQVLSSLKPKKTSIFSNVLYVDVREHAPACPPRLKKAGERTRKPFFDPKTKETATVSDRQTPRRERPQADSPSFVW